MRATENIKRTLKNTRIKTNPDVDQSVLDDLINELNKLAKSHSAALQSNLWRTLMTNRKPQLAAAAIVIAALVIISLFWGGSIDGTSVAWGDVSRRAGQVDHVHVYWFKSRGDDLRRDFEGWYAYGKLVIRKSGDIVYDDGHTQQTFDKDGRRVAKGPSHFAEGQTVFDVFTAGLLSDKNEQLSQQIPASAGDDFLMYEFDLPADHPESEYLERICITVGRNSLLPIQMKVYDKDGDYDLAIFDYEAPEKSAAFFETPMAASANARGEVVLDGEEVTIDIEGAPGLKEAIVRLHGKYEGPADQLPSHYHRRMTPERFRMAYGRKGGAIYKLDVTFITEEGYRSQVNDVIVLRLNEAKQCGVGSEAGSAEAWPDGKYRNIRFSPILKPTNKGNVYIVEISCWIKTK